MNYFAYGSNLDEAQMRDRCPGSRRLYRALLPGYRFTFPRGSRWGGGVAGIEPDPEERVLGVVYRMSPEDWPELDDCEGVRYGAYRREQVSVLPLTDEGEPGEPEVVWTYFAAAQPGGPFPPSPEYLETILRGARQQGLPEEYLREISRAAERGRGE